MDDIASLRQKIRQRRAELPAAQQSEKSAAIFDQIKSCDFFESAFSIGYYCANQGEVDTTAIASAAQKANKFLYLPVLHASKARELKFYRHRFGDHLEKGAFNIDEPETTAGGAINPWELDLLFVPLVAFDERCDRIGRGAGYYDKTLAFVNELPNEPRPILVGLAYEFQKIPQVTPNTWDVPMDYIVTEERVYKRSVPDE